MNKLDDRGDLEKFFFSNKYFNKRITGKAYNKPFIDIGLPNDFFRANNFIIRNFFKPAVYFDRDGVLNKIKKNQYISNPATFKWTPGAKKIIKYFNDNNYYVFIITNQAGIGKGYVKLKDYFEIEDKIFFDLRMNGAHIDKIYFCPFHEKAIIKKYKKRSFYRKPNPGMILQSIKEFPVIKKDSYFIGDNISDREASKKAKIKFLMFKKKNLYNFIKAKIKL